MAEMLLKKPRETTPSTEERDDRERGTMQLVSCFLRPDRLDAVTAALDQIPVGGMTVTEVRGFGRQKGQVEHYRGGEYTIRFLSKIRVDVVVPSEEVNSVVTAVQKAAHTGQVGDGKLFVTPVQQVLRIRTGERGIGAL